MGIRKIEILRAGWGLALVLAPRWVLTHVHRVRIDRPAVVVARILGTRHLAQAALTVRDPGPRVLALGAGVDALHALSGLGLAAVDPSRASAGLIDASITSGFAAAGLRDARRRA